MEYFEEFKEESNKCADSLSKWIDNCEFTDFAISRVFMDYFMAYCQKYEIPLEKTLTLVKKLYKIRPLFFSVASENEDSVCDCCRDDEDNEPEKPSDFIEQLQDIIQDAIKKIKDLEEKAK